MRHIAIVVLLLAGTAILLPIQKEERKSFQLKKREIVRLNLKFADSIYIKGVDGDQLDFHLLLKSTDDDFKKSHIVNYEQKDGELTISTDVNDDFWQEKRKAEAEFHYSSKTIIYTVSVPKDHPLYIESISGNVQIRGMQNELKVKTISGFVDCDWEGKPADLYMSSVTGEVYTDINVNYSTPIRNMPIVGYPLRGKIKKGGTSLHLETVSDNIYFRQRK